MTKWIFLVSGVLCLSGYKYIYKLEFQGRGVLACWKTSQMHYRPTPSQQTVFIFTSCTFIFFLKDFMSFFSLTLRISLSPVLIVNVRICCVCVCVSLYEGVENPVQVCSCYLMYICLLISPVTKGNRQTGDVLIPPFLQVVNLRLRD